MENSLRVISMRQLTTEVYPNRKYSKVKSTLSEYVKALNESGMIEKIRQGRRVYVSYSQKALRYADNSRIERMKKLISKPAS